MVILWFALAFAIGMMGHWWWIRTSDVRPEPASVADLLGWAYLVAPGVVLMKDGALLAGVRFLGPDPTRTPVEELDALARGLNDALVPFSDGWMFHFDAITRPAAGYAGRGSFPDGVTSLIDEERRAAYEGKGAQQRFETHRFLVATYLPPDEKSRRALSFLHSEGSDSLESAGWGAEVDRFQRSLEELYERLRGRLPVVEPLGSSALLTHLHDCLTGLPHPILPPPFGAYLNRVLCDQDLEGGDRPRIGEQQIRVIAVEGWPDESFAAMLADLPDQEAAFRWSTRVIPLGREQAEKVLRAQQLAWFQKRKGAGSWAGDLARTGKEGKTVQQLEDDALFENADARSMALSAKAALADNSSGMVRYCVYNSVMVVMHEDESVAERIAADLRGWLNNRGFTTRLERVNALDAFLGTLPGDGFHNVRRPLLSSQNVADLLPCTAVWPGRALNPSPRFPPNSPALMWADTDGRTPFRVNIHERDVGHHLIIGSTGGGKSTLAQMIGAQWFRYPGAQLWVFDRGDSFRLLAEACGAQVYDLDPGAGALELQPLVDVDQPGERAWALDWLEAMLAQDVSFNAERRQRLERALALVGRLDRPSRTLSSLMVQIQDTELREALRFFTRRGGFALLDGDRDSVSEGSFQLFETARLMELGTRVAGPVLLYLFHRIEQRLSVDRPTLALVEEASDPLAHPQFGPRIENALRRWRKVNGSMGLITQSIADLSRLPNRHVIMDSCPTWFILPNAAAASAEQRPMYVDLGLNPAEIDVIAGATPARDYYFRSPSGSRLFRLALGPVARSFVFPRQGWDIERTLEHVASLRSRYGAAWPGVWLQEASCVSEAEQFFSDLEGSHGSTVSSFPGDGGGLASAGFALPPVGGVLAASGSG